jgi:hypothetical protein
VNLRLMLGLSDAHVRRLSTLNAAVRQCIIYDLDDARDS